MRTRYTNTYDFPPSLSPQLVTVKAWNLWEEEVELQVILKIELDEDCNRCVTGISFVTPCLDSEFVDLMSDVRDSLIQQGFKHIEI